MKLYYSPGACSLSPHIVLREAGLPFQLVRVDLQTKRLPDGSDFRAQNPKGYVPALELDSGEWLTEGAAIVQYVADQKPEAKLAPAAYSLDRYRLQEWLSYIGSEIHKSFGPLFSPDLPEEQKQIHRERIGARFDFVDQQLSGRSYLLGDDFTCADAYLYVTLRWAKLMGIDLSNRPALSAYFERISERPAVKEAIQAESLRS